MMLKQLACATALAVVLGAAGAAGAAAPAPVPATDAFDTRVDAAKGAMMGDPQAALTLSSEARKVAEASASDPRRAVRVATAEWLQGEALLRLNRLDEAKPVIRDGLATAAKAAPNTKLHGDLMMAQAGVLATQGQVQDAMRDLQAAYRIFGKAGEARSQAMALMNIGSIYQDARDYTKVLQYFAQAAELYPGDPSLLVTARNNIGNAYKAQKKYVEAEAELERALAIARQMKSPLIEANVLANLASAEVEHGRIDAAQRHVNEALRIGQTDPGAREWLPGVRGVAAQVELKRGRVQAAARLLERTFEGVDLEQTTLPDRDFHEAAYRAYWALGDEHRALVHLRAFKRLDDGARDLAASTNAALMAAQFDYANQASRIATLKAGQLQRDIELSRSRNLITAVLLAGSVLIGALLLAAFLSIRRSRNEVRKANGKLGEANTSLAKALNARTEFLATTSHEIRTPLNGVLGMTQAILAEPKLDPALREKIALVHSSGETMRALVDDILDLSKIETGKMVISRAEMDLEALCRDARRLWTEQAESRGLKLTLDTAEAPKRIVEDVGRIRQIVFNLMSNAIKFTHEGGVRLTVRAEAAAEGPETLVLAITDTGIGIPAERLDDVFESFRQVDGSITRAYGGTGLGLAICRNLARAMGGDIDVESTLGLGSTFTVRLPLERAVEAPAVAVEAGEAPDTLEAARVLLADANPLSQAVLRATLTPQTRAVETAALKGDILAAAASGRFDLVLVEAMTLGDEVESRVAALTELTAAAAPALVAVMVAGAGEEETARLQGAGAVQVIHKPIAAPALAEQLRTGFSQRAADTLSQQVSAA